jgi:formylglycine-generating enzyme required for sulfatase activity
METVTISAPIIPTIPFFEMLQLPGQKAFKMGGKEDHELPVHPVNIAPFYMGKYPITQQLWEYIMGENPAHFKGKRRPVDSVSWDDIRQNNGFLDRLNGHEAIQKWLNTQNLVNYRFRLPSESEWEYAARGGEQHEYAGSNDIDRVAWYRENSHNETKPVALKAPNQFGLYDMSGNVWEWCEDDWHENYKKAPDDGRAWVDAKRNDRRVLRGGSFWDYAVSCRVADRSLSSTDNRSSFIGCRLALSPQLTAAGQGE